MGLKIELVGMNRTELEKFLEGLGEKRFRGRQVYRWVYRNKVFSFEEMSDLPVALRALLAETALISLPEKIQHRVSQDGTQKLLLRLKDEKTIEMVVIPQSSAGGSRYTACVSSQVGCPVGCGFCATGRSGFERNLEVHEIVGQVLLAAHLVAVQGRQNLAPEGRGLTNVVFMGMGEPFLNYQAVVKAIRLVTDNEGINIGQRHITVSTAGEVQGIRRLAEEGLQVTLAVSLHAARDELRNALVPMNRKYPLSQLRDALQYYTERTGRRVTLEYTLLDKVNTSREDALRLTQFARSLLVNINLIPYNEIGQTGYKSPNKAVINEFRRWLAEAGINTVVREEKGSDIEAACGQLRAKKQGDTWKENPRLG